MIIAGEISGDIHAGDLVAAIKESLPNAVFFGIGGDRMKEAGVELFYEVKDMAVMGITEIILRFGFFRRVFKHMLQIAEERKPDAVILVDYPGFNLRFAEKVHKMGIKTIYYICPQVWAWNRARIPKIAASVDRLISIFQFEKEHFEGTGLKVDFVGHPLVDEAKIALHGETPELPWNDGKPRVAILPGSRHQEIDRILPVLWKTALLIENKHAKAGFIIATPSEEISSYIREKLSKLPDGPSSFEIVAGVTKHVLRQATAAMVASGTATVETALMECPMVIVYKVAPITAFIGKRLIKIPYIGMVNIMAGKRICPELLQEKAQPAAIAAAMDPLVLDTPERGYMITQLGKVSATLGEGGAIGRAAAVVIDELGY